MKFKLIKRGGEQERKRCCFLLFLHLWLTWQTEFPVIFLSLCWARRSIVSISLFSPVRTPAHELCSDPRTQLSFASWSAFGIRATSVNTLSPSVSVQQGIITQTPRQRGCVSVDWRMERILFKSNEAVAVADSRVGLAVCRIDRKWLWEGWVWNLTLLCNWGKRGRMHYLWAEGWA